MFEYEIHKMRSAQLIRQAADHRLGLEALRARRASRRVHREQAREGQDHSQDQRRSRMTFAA
ncbi:hypothetical protein ACWDA7_24150 [Streptomyces sp. NPDC001156]